MPDNVVSFNSGAAPQSPYSDFSRNLQPMIQSFIDLKKYEMQKRDALQQAMVAGGLAAPTGMTPFKYGGQEFTPYSIDQLMQLKNPNYLLEGQKLQAETGKLNQEAAWMQPGAGGTIPSDQQLLMTEYSKGGPKYTTMPKSPEQLRKDSKLAQKMGSKPSQAKGAPRKVNPNNPYIQQILKQAQQLKASGKYSDEVLQQAIQAKTDELESQGVSLD
jgi:hypothetical protein